jgi:DNA helicase-2/ATP-dependent DNA helicase PcrA
MPDSLRDSDSNSTVLPASGRPESARRDFLASLNAQQRVAVEHGLGQARIDHAPLLIIAGAGSGKTNTLAHRVAHLVLNGVDPQRILLLTFSRRAAAEMERRATHLLHRALGAAARPSAGALQWAGTFHSVGARLLREHAASIGLAESFSILDRGDAEDLMAIVRHELDVDVTKRRFPAKGTCLAIYSRVVNSEARWRTCSKRPTRGAFPGSRH